MLTSHAYVMLTYVQSGKNVQTCHVNHITVHEYMLQASLEYVMPKLKFPNKKICHT